jgi:arsenical resistance protein ArsH
LSSKILNGSSDLPNIVGDAFQFPIRHTLNAERYRHIRPRILLLYGSVHERSYSRFLAFEAQSLLEAFGAETRVFDPHGLPLPDGAPATHAKVAELRELAAWSEGQVWCAPERHGAMSD